VEEKFTLCTIHRAENTDDKARMHNIFKGLGDSKTQIILPLHPRTRNKLSAMSLQPPANVHIVDPVGYLEMCWLEEKCELIVTDSGGVQKEAYFHSKRCVTLRDETEWVELVKGGYNTIVGSDPELIKNAINIIHDIDFNSHLYGDGECASRIVTILLDAVRKKNLEQS